MRVQIILLRSSRWRTSLDCGDTGFAWYFPIIIIIMIIIIIIIKKPGEHGSWWTGWDYPNDSITKNGQNPETSPGDLRRLVVTQTPVKNHQLTLMWKALKEYYYYYYCCCCCCCYWCCYSSSRVLFVRSFIYMPPPRCQVGYSSTFHFD